MPLISAYGLIILRRRLLLGRTAYSVNGEYGGSSGAVGSDGSGDEGTADEVNSSISPHDTARTNMSACEVKSPRKSLSAASTALVPLEEKGPYLDNTEHESSPMQIRRLDKV